MVPVKMISNAHVSTGGGVDSVVVVVVAVVAAFLVLFTLFTLLITILFICLFSSNYLNITIPIT